MLRTVRATRYVTPLREGGSMPGLVEADDDGLYVLKFHGAAQGSKVLVAEIICGEMARALGLVVPELTLLELDTRLGAAEPDPDVRELIERSGGLNLGVDFLPGALPFRPAVGPAPDPAVAADVVWFDALVTNPDRTVRNTNLLVWHKRAWLIDHGASLYIQYTWRDPGTHARQPFERIRDHVLLPYASSIEEADTRLAAVLDREALGELVDLVPDAWLDDGDLKTQRRRYVDYLVDRLAASHAWVAKAEQARVQAHAAAVAGVQPHA